MRSRAREALSRLMAEQGINGALLVPNGTNGTNIRLGPDGPPPDPFTFPPCQCAKCRAGHGTPDTSVQLRADNANDLPNGNEQ
ncbi:hypothetical protein AB0I22_10645 [Streptomyces sp. NPDC050610]|uniref:hypothetical protein n=1 Tax=Streptomyces sp. NPDC050610 TaxID=3157097 RepID=UPI003414E3D7